MKLKSLFSILGLLIIVSCSSDDDSNMQTDPISGNYFPSNADDTWVYNVENTSTSNPELEFTGTDLVTINSVNGNSYTIEVNNGTFPPNGTMNSILNSGTLTKTESTLEFDGELPLLNQLDIISNTDITLTDFVVYDLNADSNSELISISNTISEDIDLEGTIIPITILYTITNTKKPNLNSLTVDGEVFNSVIQTEINLNLTVSATINILGNSTTQELLEAQDVLTITNYFAEDIGLIKSEANQSFQLNEDLINLLALGGISIDFPTNGSVDNVQEIDSYILN